MPKSASQPLPYPNLKTKPTKLTLLLFSISTVFLVEVLRITPKNFTSFMSSVKIMKQAWVYTFGYYALTNWGIWVRFQEVVKDLPTVSRPSQGPTRRNFSRVRSYLARGVKRCCVKLTTEVQLVPMLTIRGPEHSLSHTCITWCFVSKYNRNPLIRMHVIRIANYPNRFGPSGKSVENSTQLTCLEITGYRIKYSTVLWLKELHIRCGRKV